MLVNFMKMIQVDERNEMGRYIGYTYKCIHSIYIDIFIMYYILLN